MTYIIIHCPLNSMFMIICAPFIFDNENIKQGGNDWDSLH